MSDSNNPAHESPELQGPGDPDAVEPGQPQPGAGNAHNIREEQLTQAAGTVPASYVGSGTSGSRPKPEEAADESGMRDSEEK
ncbi:hypothetical protein [Arthrobacter sp. D1-17]